MQKHSDEALVAYLDGELDPAEQRHVEAWLEADPAVRERLDALARSDDLLRDAFAEIAAEPVPERLVAAARGNIPAQEAEILVLRPRRAGAGSAAANRRWQIGLAAAAGLFGIVVGGTGTFVGMGLLNPAAQADERQVTAAATSNLWLDNAAAAYKLAVSAGDNMLVDVPASNDPREVWQKVSLPQVRVPDLKPWGLNFRGARLVVANGRPAAQLVYTTDNKAIGPLTLTIGASKQPDATPTVDRRQDLTVLHWNRQGRSYALVGKSDMGYLWGIANDIAWQLDSI